jgi:hypothetical protein
MKIIYTIAAVILTVCAIVSIKTDGSTSVTLGMFAAIFVSLAVSSRNKNKRKKLHKAKNKK